MKLIVAGEPRFEAESRIRVDAVVCADARERLRWTTDRRPSRWPDDARFPRAKQACTRGPPALVRVVHITSSDPGSKQPMFKVAAVRVRKA